LCDEATTCVPPGLAHAEGRLNAAIYDISCEWPMLCLGGTSVAQLLAREAAERLPFSARITHVVPATTSSAQTQQRPWPRSRFSGVERTSDLSTAEAAAQLIVSVGRGIKEADTCHWCKSSPLRSERSWLRPVHLRQRLAAHGAASGAVPARPLRPSFTSLSASPEPSSTLSNEGLSVHCRQSTKTRMHPFRSRRLRDCRRFVLK